MARSKPKRKDFYRILGLSPNAHHREIEQSYWEQAHALQKIPTRRAAIRLKAINEAYEILGSPHRRAAYDARMGRFLRERDDEREGLLQAVVGLIGRAFRPE
ncbi:MAG TPA: DnaJ domain-containing protein [Dehalococcoidia bacterium]|nr:DnaJ domain-containing protein [Dehalococcoidia bacterium]